MPCVGNNAFTTLPSYSVNLVCHLPFKEVEALRVAVDVDPYDVPEGIARGSVPAMRENTVLPYGCKTSRFATLRRSLSLFY